MSKMKLKLDDLKVQSFVTSLDNRGDMLMGGLEGETFPVRICYNTPTTNTSNPSPTQLCDTEYCTYQVGYSCDEATVGTGCYYTDCCTSGLPGYC
jgi:hypothetical protein